MRRWKEQRQQFIELSKENDLLKFQNKVLLAMCTISEGDYQALCTAANVDAADYSNHTIRVTSNKHKGRPADPQKSTSIANVKTSNALVPTSSKYDVSDFESDQDENNPRLANRHGSFNRNRRSSNDLFMSFPSKLDGPLAGSRNPSRAQSRVQSRRNSLQGSMAMI